MYWQKKDDFFGEKMMIFMEKIEIRLRNQNLKKKKSPVALIKDNRFFFKRFTGGSGVRRAAPASRRKKLFYCRVWLAVSTGGTPYGER